MAVGAWPTHATQCFLVKDIVSFQTIQSEPLCMYVDCALPPHKLTLLSEQVCCQPISLYFSPGTYGKKDHCHIVHVGEGDGAPNLVEER